MPNVDKSALESPFLYLTWLGMPQLVAYGLKKSVISSLFGSGTLVRPPVTFLNSTPELGFGLELFLSLTSS